VLVDGASITPEELFVHFCEKLPYYAMPRYVELVDELPRSAVGRVMKHLLRERPIDKAVWDFEQLGLRVAPSERRQTGPINVTGRTMTDKS
jgi:crotonobetaine/carnitine-CoA ligase